MTFDSNKFGTPMGPYNWLVAAAHTAIDAERRQHPNQSQSGQPVSKPMSQREATPSVLHRLFNLWRTV